ncbi:hypothetical protein GCM10022255_001090 [Dactylosporangium darangshiense]|uniref:Uncharacterized protein n=2 Tax=Dactylosporangium darangshiense TaxID=579108 RepID=A0ABP8CTK6_9ACTN
METANRQAETSTVLLHGSAFAIAADHAIAVLDGGLGQGKTSLAMGLAARYGQLIVDEFMFAAISGPHVTVLAAPQLPWHVRPDMATHVLNGRDHRRLLFEADLHEMAGTAAEAVPLWLILLPDRALPPGETLYVPPNAARELLRCAVTDHARKLANPCLDHVSIFESQEQIATADGTPLHARSTAPARDTERVLDALVTVPAIRVGIGGPADLPVSVTAAGNRFTELLAWHQA